MSTTIQEKIGFSTSASKQQLLSLVGHVLTLIVLVVTAVHAVSISITHYPPNTLMNTIRALSPVIIEGFAAVALYGLLSNSWKGNQKLIANIMDTAWLAFASMNMILSFSVEGGGQLPAVFEYWLIYGFPLSLLVMCFLFIMLKKYDPSLQRQSIRLAAKEVLAQEKFNAEMAVFSSSEMEAVRKQQAWHLVIQGLEGTGFTDEQLQLLRSATPTLKQTRLPAITPPNSSESSDNLGPDRKIPILNDFTNDELLSMVKSFIGANDDPPPSPNGTGAH